MTILCSGCEKNEAVYAVRKDRDSEDFWPSCEICIAWLYMAAEKHSDYRPPEHYLKPLEGKYLANIVARALLK